MTVADLIATLSTMPQDATVVAWNVFDDEMTPDVEISTTLVAPGTLNILNGQNPSEPHDVIVEILG